MHVSTDTYKVLANIPFSTKTHLILLMSAFFFAKNQHFFGKLVPLLKAIVWELCQRFFSSVFSFWKIGGVSENLSFISHASEYGSGWQQIGCKWEKKTMTSQFADMASLSIFFHVAMFFLSSFSADWCGMKCHVKSTKCFFPRSWGFREGEVPENQQYFAVL